MLTPRMEAIAQLLGKNKKVADIGCDHGKLSIYLIKNNLADVVYATDISVQSLEKAKILKEKENIEKIFFFVGDGFDAFDVKPDAAVIAGMGGEVIKHIISHKNARTKLVLQPMKDSDIVYKKLVEDGFAINVVQVVSEGGRFYEIIVAEPGMDEVFDYSLPPINKLVKNHDAKKFLIHKISVLEKALKGAQKSESKRADEIKAMIEKIKGVIFDAYGQ